MPGKLNTNICYYSTIQNSKTMGLTHSFTVEWIENGVTKTSSIAFEGPGETHDNLKARVYDKTGIRPQHQVFSVNINKIIAGTHDIVVVSSNQ